jgi:hypothetical protein
MDPCVVYGPIISFVIDILKRVPFIARYPKVVAALLALALALFPVVGVQQPSLEQIVQCFIVAFSGSVATHEVSKRSVLLAELKKRLSGDGGN